MLLKNEISPKFHRHIIVAGVRFIAFVLFIGLSAASAFSQMTYGTNYSDTWLSSPNQPYTNTVTWDEDNSARATYQVSGYGAVDGSTASYSHYYSPLTATMHGPNGLTSSNSASGSSYVRVDLTLPFDINQPGNYSTSHVESAYCPGCNCYHPIGGAGSGLGSGISFACYNLVGYSILGNRVIATYQVFVPCPATCKATTATYRFSVTRGVGFIPPPYLAVAEPYVNGPLGKLCLRVSVPAPVSQCTGCGDVNLPPLPFFFTPPFYPPVS